MYVMYKRLYFFHYQTTVQPKPPQQRAPEFGARPPRPEFYQQGPYGAPNRPQGQQQRPPPPRTPGDNKASPWNLIRQTLPPDVGVRGPGQLQQQRGPPPQNYNNINNNNSMQQRPPMQQEQQQYRQQLPMQDRRGPTSRVGDDRTQFRSENGRQARPVGGDDDEEVVVNSSINQQQQPVLNRRDSTVFAGGRVGDGTADPNKQWQPRAVAPGAVPYGKPQQQEQQYGRQSLVIPEGQEQTRFPTQAAGGYNSTRPAAPQEDDGVLNGSRQPAQVQNGMQKIRDLQPQQQQQQPQQQKQQQQQQQQHLLTRRDSVLDANTAKAGVDMMSRKNDLVAEYGRRPAQDLLQDEGGNRRQPELTGGARRLAPGQESVQEDGKRPAAEFKKTEQEDVSGRRLTDFKNIRSEVGPTAEYGAASRQVAAATRPDDRPSAVRDYEQPRYERKTSPEKDQPAAQRPVAVEHGNRASELRKLHFEATHLKTAKEQTRVAHDDGKVGSARGREPPVDETRAARDYAAAAVKSTSDGDPLNERYRATFISAEDRVAVGDDEVVPQLSKNSRPDTLKIIKGIIQLFSAGRLHALYYIHQTYCIIFIR